MPLVEKKTKVVVAMSGGVDSSVCLAMMLELGFDCVGMTMRLWSGRDSTQQSCCGIESVMDARLVADQFQIPHYAINFQKEFWEEVIEVFADEYFKGRTPSPCILCNEKLKFSTLYQKAVSIGAQKVCTGHYARIEFDEEKGRYLLKKATDLNKDQSYFLFSLTQEQLSKTLFPLGTYTKPEVRKMAESRGLITAKKPESQDICFIPDGDYKAFLEKHFKDKIPKKGMIQDVEGTPLGEHEGIHSVTIGQRHGLGIAFGKPLYVTHIDPKTNTVIMGEKEKTHKTRFIVSKMNWILYETPPSELRASIKIRARSKEAPGTLKIQPDGTVLVTFDQPQNAITPGQATVFYQDEIVIGGGWIESVEAL